MVNHRIQDTGIGYRIQTHAKPQDTGYRYRIQTLAKPMGRYRIHNRYRIHDKEHKEGIGYKIQNTRFRI